MTASDGLTLGTALAQLNTLQREFDALETATSKVRDQLDRILEQFDRAQFEQPNCDGDDADAASGDAKSDPGIPVVGLDRGSDCERSIDLDVIAFEQSFSDDVDRLFDMAATATSASQDREDDRAAVVAQCAVSRALGRAPVAAGEEAGGQLDWCEEDGNAEGWDDEIWSEGDQGETFASAEVEPAPDVAGDDDDGVGNGYEPALAAEHDRASLAPAGMTAALLDRAITLESQCDHDETDRLVACLSICEASDSKGSCAAAGGLTASTIGLLDDGPAEQDVFAPVSAADLEPVNGDDLEIMAASMHQPVMAFAEAQAASEAASEEASEEASEDGGIFQLPNEKMDYAHIAADTLCDTACDGPETDAPDCDIENVPVCEAQLEPVLIDDDVDGDEAQPERPAEVEMLAGNQPPTAISDDDAPQVTPAEATVGDAGAPEQATADDAGAPGTVVALQPTTRDDVPAPQRRGGLTAALIGAGAIAAGLAIAPQYVPMDRLQNLPQVQDLLQQLGHLTQFLA